MNRYQTALLTIGLALLFVFSSGQADKAHGFELTTGFSSLNSGQLGTSVDLTWSIVRDGTPLPGRSAPSAGLPSDLIAVLDARHGGVSPGGNTDLMQRSWFGLFQSVFDRWDELSGVNYQYEPNDDGFQLNGPASGNPGVRGDTRIGGQTLGNIFAYANFPGLFGAGDTVFNTNRGAFVSSSGNFLQRRNTLAHEIGHTLGLQHVGGGSTILLQAGLSSAFDGPQLDDILGIQRLYGDANEEGLGNDTFANATSLGSLLPGSPIAIGTDGDTTRVDPEEVDFLSIDSGTIDREVRIFTGPDGQMIEFVLNPGSLADVDVFSFTVEESSFVDIRLTPKGPTYVASGQSFNASAQNDLSLELLDVDPTRIAVLDSSNANGLGAGEEILGFQLAPGEYFVRIQGEQDADAGIQLFQLDLAATAVPEPTSIALLAAAAFWLPCRRRSRRR